MIGPTLAIGGVMVAADLHLGLEDQQEGSMALFSSSEHAVETIASLMASAASEGEPIETLVLDGDVLDDFSLRNTQSRVRITRLLRRLGAERQLVLVRGNHDTMLGTLHLDTPVVDSYRTGDVLVAHGDRPLDAIATDEELRRARTIVIGHEHPVLALTDGLRLERFKCFLRVPRIETPYGVKELYVLPSAHPDILGTDVDGTLRTPVAPGPHPDAEVVVVGDPPRSFGPIGALSTPE